MPRTMSFSNYGRLVVTVHTAANPSDAEWNAYVALARSLEGGKGMKIFIYSAGGGPDARQRRALVDVIASATPVTAVVSPSPRIRAIGMAFQWFNKALRIFPPAELDQAFDYLGLELHERDRVHHVLQTMTSELGVSIPLSSLETARSLSRAEAVLSTGSEGRSQTTQRTVSPPRRSS